MTPSGLLQVIEVFFNYLINPAALVLMVLSMAVLLVLTSYHSESRADIGSDQQEYTEDYEQQRGKGSFPAMITPAYQRAKKANQLASQVSALVLVHHRLC